MRKRLQLVSLLILACSAAVPAIAAEGRTPVYLDGTVILADGKYVMTRNIVSAAGVPVIDIVAPYVDLDLNGFTIFGGPGAPCIQISGSPTEVRIFNGTLVDGGQGIVRPPALGPAQTIIIEDMKIEAMNGVAIELWDVETAVIRRNRIIDPGGPGISLPTPGLFTHGSITDNTIKRTLGDGVFVDTAAAMEISRNQLEVVGSGLGGNGIALFNSVGCLVAENVISDPAGDGILLGNSGGNKLRNNVIRHAFGHGIYVDIGSADNFVVDNVATDCGFDFGFGHGLWVEGRRNHIEGNTLNGNQSCGMMLDAPSGANVFGRNMARGNVGVGCLPCPLLFPPESCDNSGAGNDTNLENMIPGPPPF